MVNQDLSTIGGAFMASFSLQISLFCFNFPLSYLGNINQVVAEFIHHACYHPTSLPVISAAAEVHSLHAKVF
jgi:hypothetical protein